MVIKKDLEKILKKTFTQSNIENIAEGLKEDIKKRTRLGYGVAKEGDKKKKLAPLAEATKKSKRRRKSELSSLTTPNRSNLTDTGKMLDALVSKVSGNTITIKFKDSESEDKALFAHEGGSTRPQRKFMNVSNRELQRVNQDIEKLIDNEIRKL